MRWSMCSLAALACLSIASPPPGWAIPAEKEKWVRVRTRHFVLIGDTSAKALQGVGVRLERFRNVLEAGRETEAEQTALPTTIVVFKDETAFAPYKTKTDGKPDTYRGVFLDSRDGNYIGMNGDPDQDPYNVIYHEYVHYFISRRYGDIPLWLNEGLAEFYSTFVMTEDEIEIGRPVENHVLYLMAHSLMPFVDLFGMDTNSPDYREGERQGVFYAESWALVHYLFLGKPDLKPKLQAFLDLQSGNVRANEAFRTAFGTDYGSLETALGAYIVTGHFNYEASKVDAAASAVTAQVEPVSRADLLYTLGDYLAHLTPWQTSAAEDHFRSALEAAPEHARAWAGLAGVLALQKKWTDAEAAYQKAIELGREDDVPFFLYGITKLERFIADSRGFPTEPTALPATVAAARGLLARSLELDPNRAEAYLGLGETYLYDPEDVALGITALEQARSRLPSRMEIPYYLMMLYIRAGDRASAEGLANHVLVHSQDPKILEYAHDLLAKDEARRQWNQQSNQLNDAIDKLNAGDFDAGIAQLESLLTRKNDPEVTQSARELLEKAKQAREKSREIAAYNHQVEQYNLAVGKAQAGDFPAARALLERLLPTITDPELARSTRELLQRVKPAQAETPPAHH